MSLTYPAKATAAMVAEAAAATVAMAAVVMAAVVAAVATANGCGNGSMMQGRGRQGGSSLSWW